MVKHELIKRAAALTLGTSQVVVAPPSSSTHAGPAVMLCTLGLRFGTGAA